MKKQFSPALLTTILFTALVLAPAAAGAIGLEWIGKYRQDSFDRTCTDISSVFKKFMNCNKGVFGYRSCEKDANAPDFLFDYKAIDMLRSYHVIMLPGGDYDFFSELVTLCEDEQAESLDAFFQKYPFYGNIIKESIEKEVCPDYLVETEDYYDKYFDAYISYEDFLEANEIPFTRLRFSKAASTAYVGDRASKVTLLADTIDALEADNATSNTKGYILLGHSFGGLNISDFLIELLNGHVAGTPEDTLFAQTAVRAWSAEKKERIFKKIKAISLINTFVQGQRGVETDLYNLAKKVKLKVSDPIEYYIDRVLANYETEEFESDNKTRDDIYHFALRSNRYRGNYYLKDRNSLQPKTGTPISDAFDRIADEKAVISVGCWVPPVLSDVLVQPNFIVALSRLMWREQGILNDGMVDSYSAIIPRPSVEFLLLPNLDHGSLVLKPQVRGISLGHDYNQLPFIKTLFKRLSTKIQEKDAASTQ